MSQSSPGRTLMEHRGSGLGEYTISPYEHLIPLLKGTNLAHVKTELDRGAVEMIPRKYPGPFPTAAPAERMKLLAQMGDDPKRVSQIIKEREIAWRVGNFMIYGGEDVLVEVEKVTGSPLQPLLPTDAPREEIVWKPESQRYILSVDDPFLLVVRNCADFLGDPTILHEDTLTGVPLDDVLNHTTRYFNSNNLEMYGIFDASRKSPTPDLLLRPQLGKWILYRDAGGKLQADIISGGISPSCLTMDRLADYASSMMQSLMFVGEALAGKVPIEPSTADNSRELIRQYGAKAWPAIKPNIRRLILSQGFDVELYNPMNWKMPHPISGKVASLREILADLSTQAASKGVAYASVARMQSLALGFDAIVSRYLTGANVGPNMDEMREARTSRALVLMNAERAIATSHGAVATSRLPVSQREFTPFAAETIITQISRSTNAVFGTDVWGEQIMRDGRYDQAAFERLLAQAKAMLRECGINTEGEFQETDQEAMYLHTQAMLAHQETDIPQLSRRKAAALTRLDTAYSIWITDQAEKMKVKKKK